MRTITLISVSVFHLGLNVVIVNRKSSYRRTILEASGEVVSNPPPTSAIQEIQPP